MMMRRNWIAILTAVYLAVLAGPLWAEAPKKAPAPIADHIGKWRVEVGPPGNEFYEVPAPKGDAKAAAKKPGLAPENVLRWVNLIAPDTKVTTSKLSGGAYDIQSKKGNDAYSFKISPEGNLLELAYQDDSRNIVEEPGKIVLKGTKKELPTGELPAEVKASLAKVMPGAVTSKAWSADTLAGPHYVAVVDQLAFYVLPNGQIRAAGLVNDGAMDEIDPATKKNGKEKKKLDADAYTQEMKKLLGPYREQFNIQSMIAKLGNSPKNPDGSYRYIVMGDSRSQWELWESIVKHIDSLDPKPAFVINSGDVVPRGYAQEFAEYYVPPLLKTDIPYFVAIGNHEDGEDSKAKEFRYLLGDNSLNYFFDYGKARYIFIDNCTSVQPFDETLKWLDKTLAETPKGYRKYVTAHRPPATIEKWAYHAMGKTESKVFSDMMTQYKVDEVYNGHIHAYSTATLGGVPYTLSGGGGAGLHDRYGPMGNVHHYVICDVAPDGTVTQQVVRFYDTTKEAKDKKEAAAKK